VRKGKKNTRKKTSDDYTLIQCLGHAHEEKKKPGEKKRRGKGGSVPCSPLLRNRARKKKGSSGKKKKKRKMCIVPLFFRREEEKRGQKKKKEKRFLCDNPGRRHSLRSRGEKGEAEKEGEGSRWIEMFSQAESAAVPPSEKKGKKKNGTKKKRKKSEGNWAASELTDMEKEEKGASWGLAWPSSNSHSRRVGKKKGDLKK